MIKEIVYQTRFKKDLKKLKKSDKDLSLLKEVIIKLQKEEPLDDKYVNHPLQGKFKGYYDCHIENDWVLIYGYSKNRLQLVCVRTGSHSELFG